MRIQTEIKLKSYFLLFILLIGTFYLQAQQKNKKVIFILADGIPADVIEKLQKPFIDSIANIGGYKRAFVGGEKGGYSQSPTISAVGYNSLLTGTWANKHNVWDNDIKEPNYNYRNIFRLVKESDPSKKIAIFSTWLDNRTKLIGESLPQAGSIVTDFHSDGYELDTVSYPHDNQSLYIHKIDERVTKEAADCIKANGPDLSWLYLEYTDDVGHRYGNSPQQIEALGYVDKQVGKILEAVQYRQKNFAEDWMILLTTDHGRDPVSGKSHGNQSDRERTTWIVTNVKDMNNYYRNYQTAITDILPTIARYMDIKIPRGNLMEIDGTSLIGKVSIASPIVHLTNNRMDIGWKPLDETGRVKIWLATTNNFKYGGEDIYHLMAEPLVSDGSVSLDLGPYPSAFYKIVLEAPFNMVNRWVFVKKY
jgi:predicted AlkP superfamily pyrophosphatase or phosphodiesterase